MIPYAFQINKTDNDKKQHKFFVLVKVILFWAVFMGLLFIGGAFLVPKLPSAFSSLWYGLTGSLCAIIAIAIYVRSEKLTMLQAGLVWQPRTFIRFCTGFLIGTAILLLMISTLMIFTKLRFVRNTRFGDDWIVVIGYLAIIPLALMEELAFRSLAFVKLLNVFDIRVTQLIVAIAFALYHVVGGQDWISSFLGPGAWAFIFGLVAIRSGGIAMPLGLHVAANMWQAVVGLTHTDRAVFLPHFERSATNAVTQSTETLGMIMQLILLLTGLALTEFYYRRRVHTTYKIG